MLDLIVKECQPYGKPVLIYSFAGFRFSKEDVEM